MIHIHLLSVCFKRFTSYCGMGLPPFFFFFFDHTATCTSFSYWGSVADASATSHRTPHGKSTLQTPYLLIFISRILFYYLQILFYLNLIIHKKRIVQYFTVYRNGQLASGNKIIFKTVTVKEVSEPFS